MTTVEDANYALSKVLDAGSRKNVIELVGLKCEGKIPRIIITLSIPSYANSQRERIVEESRSLLLEFEDINDVQIEIDNNLSDSTSKTENNLPELKNINGIKHIIAVSSGKGG